MENIEDKEQLDYGTCQECYYCTKHNVKEVVHSDRKDSDLYLCNWFPTFDRMLVTTADHPGCVMSSFGDDSFKAGMKKKLRNVRCCYCHEEVKVEDAYAKVCTDKYADKKELKEYAIHYCENCYKMIDTIKTNKKASFNLGDFTVKSGAVYVSDPCYDIDVWCMGKVENVKNGTWTAWTEKQDCKDWGYRNASITVHHVDHPLSAKPRWTKIKDLHVGVDSGQAGVFDMQDYINGHTPQTEDDWYEGMCDKTLNGVLHAGVSPHGAVSSSGYGDGGYNAYYIKKGDQIVAIKIKFL
jgi:hypothetical protein